MNELPKGRKKPKPYGVGRAYLRGTRWWTEFWYGGRCYREAAESVTTELEAWGKLAARREEVRSGRRLDIERAPFTVLAARLVHHHEAKGTSPRTRARYGQHLEHLKAYFVADAVGEVAVRVEAYIASRRHEKAAAGTIKGEVDLLAQAFKVAKLPRLDRPEIRVSNTRSGFLEPDKVERVAEHLPPALRPVVWFAYYTGWRKGEVLTLRWKAVDFAAQVVRLEPGETKTGRARNFPFGADDRLAGLLKAQRASTTALEHATGQIVPWVFHRGGAAIRDLDDAWRTACKAAAVPGRLFHDLRRSAALALRRTGLSETDIMELCGWETASMFRRYCVTDTTGLAERLREALTRTTPAQTRPAGASDRGNETR